MDTRVDGMIFRKALRMLIRCDLKTLRRGGTQGPSTVTELMVRIARPLLPRERATERDR